MYEDNGIFNLSYQIPKIILSIITKYISLTEKKIIKVKQEKTIYNAFSKLKSITKCIFLKIFYFSI